MLLFMVVNPLSYTYNHGQKSWDKFALLGFCAPARCECNFTFLTSPQPPYNVENYYLQFPLIFHNVLGGQEAQ